METCPLRKRNRGPCGSAMRMNEGRSNTGKAFPRGCAERFHHDVCSSPYSIADVRNSAARLGGISEKDQCLIRRSLKTRPSLSMQGFSPNEHRAPRHFYFEDFTFPQSIVISYYNGHNYLCLKMIMLLNASPPSYTDTASPLHQI